jgi:hypothetical protein
LNADAIAGLDERLTNLKLKPYHLKPSTDTDNCASGIGGLLTPNEPLRLSNINPTAAAEQWIISIGKAFIKVASYDILIGTLKASGITRDLYTVAHDEDLHRAKAIQSSSAAENPLAKEEDQIKESAQAEDNKTSQGMK